MRKSKEWFVRYEIKLGIQTKAECICFRVAFVLLLLYVEFVVFAHNGMARAPILTIISAMAVIPLCFAGVRGCSKLRGSSKIAGDKRIGKKKIAIFAAFVFVVTFLWCFMWQRAFWPGAFSSDSIYQYSQSVNGKYDNWHPVLHTWLFFTLPYKIFHAPSAIITMQLVWFSAAVTYLGSVLYRNGCTKLFFGISYAYILGNPNTMKIMLYPWKDSAMSIFALILFTQVLQIYMSQGKWLRKWNHLAALTITAFFTAEMRHNAILLIAPVFIILLFFKEIRKQVLISLVSCIMATMILRGPVFSLMNVQPPGQRVVETSGLPMTILGNVYANNPDSLDEDIKMFMERVGPKELWVQYCSTGVFNSIKWNGIDTEEIEREGLKNVLLYAIRALVSSPRQAWWSFTNLTKMVWSIDGGSGWSIDTYIEENTFGIQFHDQNKALYNEMVSYSARLSYYAIKYFFNYIGIIILFLLFMAVGNIGGGNLRNVFIVLAPMMYNFGTMLLLSGSDFRFFHYNFLVIIPLMFIICMRNVYTGPVSAACTVTSRNTYC